MINKKFIYENVITIIYAIIIAVFIRTLFIQPFYIPSSSMEPNLLVGDRLFVSKYSYGYSRHSFPFSPNFTSSRYFKKIPKRGDVVVFKTPADNRTDYIKRLIGLPGDKIQIIDGEIFLNDKKIQRKKIQTNKTINCGERKMEAIIFRETFDNEKKYVAVYSAHGSMANTDVYLVPDEHFFFMGDNRDCSKDSRYLGSVGYVHFNNIVGKAQIIFFSNDKKRGSLFKFWNWDQILRMERFLMKIE